MNTESETELEAPTAETQNADAPKRPFTPGAYQFDVARYPLASGALPGTGGEIRRETEDFQVTEVPAYPLAGEGEHLYLWVEKRDTNTRWVIEYLRDTLGIPEAEIGWAGLKDRRALTRQWISVPARFEEAVTRLNELAGVTLLETARHTNRLATGHLAGNRFRILVRDPQGTEAQARAILDVLIREGVPNYFGPQRFGKMGDNATRGHQILASGRFRKHKWLDKLLTSAFQSLLFNEWVKTRVEDGTFGHVLEGDIAVKHASGGKFQVGDPAVEDPRAVALEISATGPMFGRKYHEAHGAAREVEDRVLAHFGIDRALFKPLLGDRRAIRFPLEESSLEWTPEGYWVSFFLPKGAFATAVLRELMKTDVGGEEE
jgi:tRNA pseudouridine13 synthase